MAAGRGGLEMCKSLRWGDRQQWMVRGCAGVASTRGRAYGRRRCAGKVGEEIGGAGGGRDGFWNLLRARMRICRCRW